ncbi:MAG: O-antigen ligase family protein [Flavobacteriales bacterium]|nr:O-antigen ligase family protein [Flavobacteriales bacterium]
MAGRSAVDLARRSFGPSIALLAAVLPLAPSLAPVSMAIMLFLGVVGGEMSFNSFRSLTWKGPLLWMVVFYLWHLVGLGWTINMDFAALDLGIKLPLLVFPLLGAAGVRSALRGPAIQAFIAANILSVAIALGLASYHSLEYMLHVRPDEVCSGYTASVPFFASNFSWALHPSYMALYLTMALVLVLNRSSLSGSFNGRWQVVVLALGVVLCASKAGWIALAGLGVLELHKALQDPGRRRRALGGLVLATVAVGALYGGSSLVQERVAQVVGSLGAGPEVPVQANSTSDRKQVWIAAVELIAAQPWLGVGTGDVKDALMAKYAELDYEDPLQKRLNAHDQYLNTAVALGLPAAICLVALILVPLWSARRHGEHAMVALLLLCGFNWAVESMLEVQAGVLFLSFFAWSLTDKRSALT